MSRICLVGAGSISSAHAEAIATLRDHAVSCVVDPDMAAAQRLARACGGSVRAFASVAEALAESAFDRAHVLVPPDRHAEVAEALLTGGKPVLLEKPLATDAVSCERLVGAALAAGVTLGVNQNFVHHPAFVRLRKLVDSGALGRPRFVSCIYNVPLRQMAARQFTHWMFRAPINILLEQAVHPLSQIATLAGPIGAVQGVGGVPLEVAPGLSFTPSLTATLAGARLPAALRFAVGQAFPFWQVSVICDDGVAVADILADRLLRYGRTRWLEVSDALLSGLVTAGGLARDSVANAAGTVLSTLKLSSRSDPFFRSMRASIAAFHAAVDSGRTPELDGQFGAALIGACERLAAAAFAAPGVAAPAVVRQVAQEPVDVAILGGTGFIGAHVVEHFLAAGKRVAVMARGIRNLPPLFEDARVALHRGDIRDADAVARAIAGAPVVVNLAHGGGGDTFATIRDAMVGGAEIVARACLASGAQRLVHVGSIASLYLGPQPAPVTGVTAPDPEPEQRADYARAKILSDQSLLRMHAKEGLKLVILRPGLVVGEGTSPFHSGLGFYNTEQHCIGWNAGRNPLPFVLVDDVADAIVRASFTPGIEGRCYNLVGDVRPSARDYIAELGRALGRPLQYHPQSPRFLWLEDSGKWLIKRATGRDVAAPSQRDFVSRGLMARFDCSDAARDLGWHPVADRAVFVAAAIGIHAP